jgi:hypothetical protein
MTWKIAPSLSGLSWAAQIPGGLCCTTEYYLGVLSASRRNL